MLFRITLETKFSISLPHSLIDFNIKVIVYSNLLYFIYKLLKLRKLFYLHFKRDLVTISVVCDFEDASLCGYQQALNDQFDWTWHSGGTNSASTGPTADHTYGTLDGKLSVESRHQKTRLYRMRTTKAQVSLRIHAVWSAPLLFAA